MAPRRFDRYMIALGMGTHPKLAELTDSEFRAHVVGVLAIAAMSPIRGRLLVGQRPAGPMHVAVAAGLPEKVAVSAMAKLEAAGVLERDEEYGCLAVHDWDRVHSPARKGNRFLPTRLRRAVIERDGYVCGLCGEPIRDDRIHIDHRIPVVRGGSDDLSNLQVAHASCNLRKGAS